MGRKKPTRGERAIAWLEAFCSAPDGKLVGQPIKLRPWQKDLLRGIYDTPTRMAIISVGRKSGKTTLSAMIVLLHLVGPEARRSSELFSSALSRDQAALLFRLASKIIRLSPALRDSVTVRDTAKQLSVPALTTFYAALSADAATNFGLSPSVVIHDELGQIRGERHELYEALETATAAQESPLSVVISTQSPTDADLLSRLIDDAKTEADPKTKLFLWTADKDADPFLDATIRQANPAFDHFQNRTEIRRMAQAAKRMPSREASFRNLILNQRVESSNSFISQSVWAENAGEPIVGDNAVYYGGLDLSEVGDLTALVLVSESEGRYSVEPVFWLPEEGLAERSRRDRTPYDLWKSQGYLQTTPGRSVEYEYIAHYLAELFKAKRIRKLAFDRWGMRHLKPWLVKAGLSERLIENSFQDFGQGYQSMSPALRTLESLLLAGKIRHGNHPVLQMCAMNAVVQADPAGNRKLTKVKSRGRIDGMIALSMAVAVASEDATKQQFFTVPVEELRA